MRKAQAALEAATTAIKVVVWGCVAVLSLAWMYVGFAAFPSARLLGAVLFGLFLAFCVFCVYKGRQQRGGNGLPRPDGYQRVQPPGWYQSVECGVPVQRYWNGQSWTPSVRDARTPWGEESGPRPVGVPTRPTPIR